jgi:hypothetical protein
MRFLQFVFTVVIVTTIADYGNAKEWRGIVPLKSTRADVERLLGPSEGDPPRYYLPEHTVYFQYSSCNCGDKSKTDEWNVPPDTVIFIRVGMKGVVKLVDLNIDLANFKKSPGAEDMVGSFVYKNDEEGFAIEGGGDYVSALIYGPRAQDDHLRCDYKPSTTSQNRNSAPMPPCESSVAVVRRTSDTAAVTTQRRRSHRLIRK